MPRPYAETARLGALCGSHETTNVDVAAHGATTIATTVRVANRVTFAAGVG